MPGIIGCTINGKYTACTECEYKNSPVGCVGRRNWNDAIERMEFTWFEVLACIDCDTVLEQMDVFIPDITSD